MKSMGFPKHNTPKCIHYCTCIDVNGAPTTGSNDTLNGKLHKPTLQCTVYAIQERGSPYRHTQSCFLCRAAIAV